MEEMRYKSLLERSELFHPAESEYFEIWEDGARGLGEGGPCKLKDEDIDDFVNRQFSTNRAADPNPQGQAKTGSDIQSWPDTDVAVQPHSIRQTGARLQASLSNPRVTPAPLQRGMRLKVYDPGPPIGQSFLLAARLQTSLVSLIAFSHEVDTGVTAGVILQAGEDSTKDILAVLKHYRRLIGDPLLLPTVLVDICLSGSIERSLETKKKLDFIEDQTQQHTWDEFIMASYQPTPDALPFGELMRRAHGSKIEVAVAQRKARVVLDLVGLLHQTYSETRAPGSPTSGDCKIKDWISHLESQARMEATDTDFLMQRVDNQTSAVRMPLRIYSISSQQESAASREIAEATKRDSSAMKSLAFLSALFFPGTFAAAIFSLEPVKALPFRIYWAITIPLTATTLGFWFAWTLYRGHVYRPRNVFGEIDPIMPMRRGSDNKEPEITTVELGNMTV
ncbi:hypothetical protein FGG08_007378 [Glutinoglossum americanum]|uniref:Uncharacterized protein n=1 Tax=Glutinoglossum americanum TaxID=1670608 RepID=A0A9P8L043_9PEZI|nr:hypothetical protein FGG08_007378 [Glutinoglossum americanum]